ncbi:trigger factor [Oceanotoga sp. DSM 15011]|jgi:trigger factor|uniref:Trigger factor n=1 Tax=Oceanotoga teriensis TaxID=515440 RepID=A0AA45C8N5_9BACT|nr:MULTISPECIES: trigger factor [Oceanotoga]MDN5343860.1 trigger factor [Oceanotoga sp.]MDO7975544.1 trigger factor [Oceanotoga teriensis]PWJ96168.1 trigger factor [Oceanotoga teriensis]UYO99951.1 trigger factor [Oceanotoga sp. DSM 15011]
MEKQLLSEVKNIKRYLVKFTKDELEKAEKDIVKEVNQHYKFEGFRKGKAPKGIVKMRLGDNFNIWVNDLLQDQAITDFEKEEQLLFPPIVDSKANDEGNIELELVLHTYPEITSAKFEDITVEVPKTEGVVEKYVENKLKELLEENAVLEPKEGKAEYNDYVRVTYTVINHEGKTIQENKESEYVLYEDDKRPIVENVIGKEKGDVVEYERDFDDKNYKYTVKVEEVYTRTIPELTEEFIKELDTEIESLNELKEKLSEEGKEMYSGWNKDYIKNYIIGEIPEHVEVEIAEETIEEYITKYVENLKKDGKFEKELEENDNDESKVRENAKTSSLKWIKELVVVDKLAKENEIEVSDEELTNAIKNIATMWQMPFDRAKQVIYSNEKLLNEVVWDTLKSKVVEKIQDKVTIKEVDSDKLENKED